MKKSIYQELTEFAKNQISELDINVFRTDVFDVHHEVFNSDYYIIGYYDAQKWLNDHEINVFDGIEWCKSKEIEHFGKSNTNYDNAEVLVNHLVYWAGYDIIEDIIRDVKYNSEIEE